MTRTPTDPMPLIAHLVDHAADVCAGHGEQFLNLVVASPGFVVLLYVSAWEAIETSESCEALKTATKRSLQEKLTHLLKIAQDVVASDDPRATILQQGLTVAQALDMGESPSDEIH